MDEKLLTVTFYDSKGEYKKATVSVETESDLRKELEQLEFGETLMTAYSPVQASSNAAAFRRDDGSFFLSWMNGVDGHAYRGDVDQAVDLLKKFIWGGSDAGLDQGVQDNG